MGTPNIKDFTEEKVCEYKGRRYYVRDNGAVYRQCKDDGIKRKWDEEWTFGIFDPNTGYMLIGQERVHRIVCAAYHGDPIGDRNVADHIDTNRCNNRPDNLRWVTKLENTLNNPITRAKIELICGSVEAFLNNPSLLYGHESKNPKFTWMRAVTKEEAQRSLARWQEWAAKPKEERKPKGEGVGEWIYDEDKHSRPTNNRPYYVGPYNSWEEHKAAVDEMNRQYYEEQYGLKDSLTQGARQLKWKTPTVFLMCPTGVPEISLELYEQNMVIGEIFCRNCYGESYLKDVDFNPEKDALIALTYQPGGVKEWYLIKIRMDDGYYVHETIGSFFEEIGGRKYFTIYTGGDWTGGEVLDDAL